MKDAHLLLAVVHFSWDQLYVIIVVVLCVEKVQ